MMWTTRKLFSIYCHFRGNNNFLEVKRRSKLATLYNDTSVLEMHHCATFFFMMEDEACSILEGMPHDEITRHRKQIIENILYTDMSKHFPFMNELKALPLKENFDPTSTHKGDLMKALVHAADVGNPARPKEIARVWTMRILSEFFSQVRKALIDGVC